jgi:hypothetical protein
VFVINHNNQHHWYKEANHHHGSISMYNQVMSDGSYLEGIRILFQDHLIPEFIPLSKVIQVNYNGIIDGIIVLDPLFFDTSIKDKLTITALDDLKEIITELVVIKSSNDSTSKAGTDGKAKFLELPFKCKDSTGFYHDWTLLDIGNI